MEPQQTNPEQTPDNNIENFKQEIKQPTIPAMDEGRPGFNPPAPGNAPSADNKNTYNPPEGAEKVFDNEDLEDETSQAAPEPKRSPDYKDKVIWGIIKAEDNISSTICGAIAGEFDDVSLFRANEQDLEDLRTTMEPFEDWIIDKCPQWLPFLIMYGSIKTKQFVKGRKAYVTNKNNKKAAGNGETVNRVYNANTGNGQRKNYTLYADGYYAKDAKGDYIKNRTENTHLLEKPNIKDLDKILSIKANNNRELLAKAFGWTDADFHKHGIEL